MALSNNPLFINTVLLGGTPEQKLHAAHQAGFDQVELWQQDVAATGGGSTALRRLLDRLPLALTDYQVLLDFDGAPEGLRGKKRAEALNMIANATALGATTLLVPASTHHQCQPGRVEEDLRWLLQQAQASGLRVAYEAMAWSQHINNTADAWQLVQRIDHAALGLVVDAFHLFVRQRTVADLDGIPAEKIFLVQLSDLDYQPRGDQLVECARHQRLLPGEGHFPLDRLLQHLQQIGYCGPLGLEVFNDARQQADATATAEAAMAALRQILAR